MGRLMDALQGIELSDEQREAIRQEEAETERLRKTEEKRALTDRESQTKAFLESLKDTPLDTPGTKKYIQSVMLSDDGGPAVEYVELSETGQRTEPKPMTATEIVKGLIDTLPKDDKGKLTLSAQAARLPGDEKPPENNENEVPDLAKSRENAVKLADEMAAAGFDVGIPVSTAGGGS